MKILVVNGPNMNLLGIREPDLYGKKTYKDLCCTIQNHAKAKGVKVCFYQSNEEGKLINKLQRARGKFDGIIFNPAGYTHTSVALADTIKAIGVPTVEVHLTNPDEREDFRKISYVRANCIATVMGKGFDSYLEALDLLAERGKENG